MISLTQEEDENATLYPQKVYSEIIELREQNLGQILSKLPHQKEIDAQSVNQGNQSSHSDSKVNLQG